MEMYIYVLRDPISNRIRYVGKTKNHKQRKSDHLRIGESKKKRCLIDFWKLRLFEQNLKHIFEIIDSVPPDEIDYWERYYITKYRNEYDDLLNMTDGGDGLQNPSEETRRKIGEKSKGRRLSKERYKEIGEIKKLKNYGNPILCYNYNGEFIGEYLNSRRASEKLNVDYKQISKCLKNTKHFTMSKDSIRFTFFYKTDDDIDTKLKHRMENTIDVGREFMRISINDEIKIYNNLMAASTELNCNFRNIWLCLNNQRKRAMGFRWEYTKNILEK